MKILFAVDGSEYSIKAAHYIATHFRDLPQKAELHLLHVHLPIPPGLALAQAQALLGTQADDEYYKEESEAALAPVEDILRGYQMPFVSTYKVGEIAQEINDHASRHAVDLIVIGSHGRGALGSLVMGSAATKLLSIKSDIPVLVVR